MTSIDLYLSLLSNVNMRITLKRMLDQATKHNDMPLVTILEAAIHTLDERIEYDERNGMAWQLPQKHLIPISRNVRINGRRTTLKLENEFWETLETLAYQNKLTVDAICSKVSEASEGGNLTSAMRVYVVRSLIRNNVLGVG